MRVPLTSPPPGEFLTLSDTSLKAIRDSSAASTAERAHRSLLGTYAAAAEHAYEQDSIRVANVNRRWITLETLLRDFGEPIESDNIDREDNR